MMKSRRLEIAFAAGLALGCGEKKDLHDEVLTVQEATAVEDATPASKSLEAAREATQNRVYSVQVKPIESPYDVSAAIATARSAQVAYSNAVRRVGRNVALAERVATTVGTMRTELDEGKAVLALKDAMDRVCVPIDEDSGPIKTEECEAARGRFEAALAAHEEKWSQ